jgi:TonB family protein
MILSMLGLSAALHGLLLFGAAGSGFRPSRPVSENQFVSTLKIIKLGTAPQKTESGKAPEKRAIEQVVERSIEAPPEPIAERETDHGEEAQENSDLQVSDNNTGENEASDDGGMAAGFNGEAQESGDGAITDEALLAYIKEFIDKNLTYPPMARRRNIQGVAGVYFEIGENGELTAVAINHSSGSSILDKAAVSLIKRLDPLKNTSKRKLALNVNIDYKLN